MCFKFNLNYTTGKQQIKILDADNINNKNENYWNFKNYCNRNNLDIHHLKNLSDDKKHSIIFQCKKLGIKYTETEYSVISIKENNENEAMNILKDIQLKINENDNNGVFKNIKENYYKVI